MLVTLILASILASTACGGVEEARGEPAASGPGAAQGASVEEGPRVSETRAAQAQTAKTRAEAEAGARTVARAGGAEADVVGGSVARAGDAKTDAKTDAKAGNGGGRAGEEAAREGGDRKVTLKIAGDPRARFSGACTVGGAERTLDGRAPERYVFEPRGKRLGCELHKEGGPLRIVLEDGAGMRSEQRIGAGESTVTFAYSNGGISSSTLSVSGAGAAKFSDGFPFDGSQ